MTKAVRAVRTAVLSAAVVAWGGCSPPAERPPESGSPAVECDLDSGPCIARGDGLEISLEILPRPVRT